MNNPYGKIPSHLPKRLTISFTIWGLMDPPGGPYHDLDKMVREHVERGFNCIRLESGAALTHDLDGNRLPPAILRPPFGEYNKSRQMSFIREEFSCDFLQRLIDLCKVCQKYNVYLILSSWYFLHTYWFCTDEFNRKMFDIPAHEKFMVFAKFLHYILKELEERGLDDRIAFAEIFNEVNGLPFVSDPENGGLASFRKDHEEAIAWLRTMHPQILFAYDGTGDDGTANNFELLPENMQVCNIHRYFMWSIYGTTLEQSDEPHLPVLKGEVTEKDLRGTWENRSPVDIHEGWYARVAVSCDLDESKLPEIEQHLEKRLAENWDIYAERVKKTCEDFKKMAQQVPGVILVNGEGVTYCVHDAVQWEDKSEKYWEMVRFTRKCYKEAGLWGAVIKTCCGPEDPCWNLSADKLRELNEEFLND